MSNYFDNFGIAQYNGQYCRQITHRSAISQDTIKRTSVFYPYQVTEGERVDTLSFLYYNDSSLDWLVYYANDVVDPYYGWHLNSEQFASYIESKYGSLAYAQLKVHHFQVEYANDDRILTIAAYNGLPSVYPTNTKKYWSPVLTDVGATSHYVRKPDDTIVSTNKIMQIDLPSTTGFVQGELISQESNNVVTGYAEIVIVDASSITVQHVIGTFNTTSDIIGFDSATRSTPTAITTLVDNIPTAELSYWKSVSVYDYEELLNEQRKIVRVVDSNYAELAQQNLKTLMK